MRTIQNVKNVAAVHCTEGLSASLAPNVTNLISSLPGCTQRPVQLGTLRSAGTNKGTVAHLAVYQNNNTSQRRFNFHDNEFMWAMGAITATLHYSPKYHWKVFHHFVNLDTLEAGHEYCDCRQQQMWILLLGNLPLSLCPVSSEASNSW